MNEKEAREIYLRGPSYDLGPDAEYYRAHGFILAWEQRQKEVDDLKAMVKRLTSAVTSALNDPSF